MNLKKYSTYSVPLIKLESSFLKNHKVSLFVKRLDLIHPYISGNKWYKLYYNLIEAKKNKYKTLLTFGGAYSNHIYSTAAAGKEFEFDTIGIIRGEEHLPLNPTLQFAKECGMKIYYINRSEYRNKTKKIFINELKNKFGNFYLLPEGGTNSLAIKGCSEIISTVDINFDYICTPCGTGGTLAGLIAGINTTQKAIGFSVLKGGDFLIKDVNRNLKNFNGKKYKNWLINLDYHFGGYAKISKSLIDFTKNFESEYKIPIEPIYTGKMFYGLFDLIKNDYFNKGETIVATHTGGLQGLKGITPKIAKMEILDTIF